MVGAEHDDIVRKVGGMHSQGTASTALIYHAGTGTRYSMKWIIGRSHNECVLYICTHNYCKTIHSPHNYNGLNTSAGSAVLLSRMCDCH